MIITVKDEYSKKRPEKPNNLYRFHLLICVIVYIVLNIGHL